MPGGGGHRRGDGIRAGGVRGEEAGLVSQFAGGAFTQVLIAARDRHLGTFLQEAFGNSQAQARGAAGDQRALSRQQAHERPV